MYKYFALALLSGSTLSACNNAVDKTSKEMTVQNENNQHQDNSHTVIQTQTTTVVNDVLNKPQPIAKLDSQTSDFNKLGFGQIKINENYKTAQLIEIPDSRIEECFYAETKKNVDSPISIQVIDNKISVISTNSSNFQSYRGVRVGDLEAEIYKKHPQQAVEKILNPYGDEKTQYSLLVWNDGAKQVGVRYDINQDKVTQIYIGNENLDLMEGCA